MHTIDNPPLQPLYPDQSRDYVPLRGLYLNLPLPQGRGESPWIYANFVTSLDGRISLDNEGGCRVPTGLTTPRDWRLFQELAARADCLLTSGRYLRELEAGYAQDALPVGSQFPDLQYWRRQNGLPEHPDVAILSSTLDFEIPHSLIEQHRRVWLFSPPGADPTLIERHRRAGAEIAGHTRTSRAGGREIRETLGALGYQRVYSVAGPQVAHTLMMEGCLDALFQTVRHRVLAGSTGTFETLAEGPVLAAPADFQLTHLYLDPGSEPGSSQHFLRFDRVQ